MHRWSKLFIPTLREAPADAEVASHKFLVRAGYIRQLGAGIYSYLFLGQRSINRIIGIVREEMDRIGQEFLLPTIHPADLWRESGRWTLMGDNMFRLQDRKGADLCLGMTHEEVMTDIARNELRSYKQLPQTWYQIQTKFRDEPRPRSGLLRVRQFIMKDSYSFDLDEAGLDHSYKQHDAAYRAIFTRCGLKFVVVEADSGAMGGSQSQEFMVYTDAGEDLIASCAACGYAANMEKATSRLSAGEGDGGDRRRQAGAGIHAGPGRHRRRDEVLQHRAQLRHQDRRLHGEDPVAGKGDKKESLQASPRNRLPARRSLRQRDEADGRGGRDRSASHGARRAGSLVPRPGRIPGPRSGSIRRRRSTMARRTSSSIPASRTARTSSAAPTSSTTTTAMSSRARDFQWTVIADIRNAVEGEGCPQCGAPLKIAKAVEVGHIFKLGDRYTNKMGARVLDANGKEVTPIMGCYGIGIERILTAAVEQGNDANGFWLPRSIAPFDVVVTITNVSDPALKATGEKIASDLEAAGFDVLLDDRDDRAGVKFKDADLIGIPYRVTVGRKASEGKVELVTRATASGIDVAIADLVRELSLVAPVH